MSETSQKFYYVDIQKALTDLRQHWEKSRKKILEEIVLAEAAFERANKAWLTDKKLSLAIGRILNVVANQQILISGLTECVLQIYASMIESSRARKPNAS